MANYCNHCGVQVEAGALVCHSCHQSVKSQLSNTKSEEPSIVSEFVQSLTRDQIESSSNPDAVRCKFCDLVISATDTECPSCGYGTPYGVSLEKEEPSVEMAAASPAKSNPVILRDSSIGTANQVSALMTRYTDAYRKARVTVAIGNSIKWVGVAIAILLLLVGFSTINDRGPNMYIDRSPDMYLKTGIGIGAIVIGLIGGAVIFIIGVLVSAEGQTLKATLDSAVNSSPFLTNKQRARIMSLPLS